MQTGVNIRKSVQEISLLLCFYFVFSATCKEIYSKWKVLVIYLQAEDDSEGGAPKVSNIPRKSVVYNRPLQNSENPYSLWPSKTRLQEISRFNVSPVDDVAPLPNIRGPRTRRRSCFPGGQQRPHAHPPVQKTNSNDGKSESTAFWRYSNSNVTEYLKQSDILYRPSETMKCVSS